MSKENNMNPDKVSINLIPKSSDPEVKFINDALKGSKEAFRRIFDDNVSKVYSVCFRFTADYDLAKELTQEVFITAWKKLTSFRYECRFSTWLHSIAVNQFLMHERTSKRIIAGREEYSKQRRHYVDQNNDDLNIDLQNAIMKLPDQAKAVLILHDVEGFMHNEIAEIMNIKTGTSKAHLHRARKLLREELKK
ncbi:MAG: RNA polymerase sigma factor [Ignavibacteria bacterium]|nr:RNA polymerase sigma factor [Ignavibacteria bacterium]